MPACKVLQILSSSGDSYVVVPVMTVIPPPGMQSQAPSANGQLSNLAKEERGPESIAFDLDDFPSLSTRPTSGGSGALQGVAGRLHKRRSVSIYSGCRLTTNF